MLLAGEGEGERPLPPDEAKIIVSFLATLIIADPNLITYEGHHFQYSSNLKTEAEKQRVKCLVWGNIHVDSRIVAETSATPCFHLTYGVPLAGPPMVQGLSDLFYLLRWQPLYKFARHLNAGATFRGHDRALYSDLQAISQTATINASTFVLFHTIQAPQIAPICRWLTSFAAEERPHLGLLFRFEPDCESDHPVRSPKWTRRAYDLLRETHAGGRLHLLSDSETLCRRYEELIGCSLSLVPIPQSLPYSSSNNGDVSKRAIRLGYLGNARDNKGFPQLPKLIEACEGEISAGTMEFRCQLHRSSGQEPASQAALDAMQTLPVTPVFGELDGKSYYNLLQQLDVVLLPYELKYYRSQTSGIFSDALAYGKVVVVPENTWMADQLRDHGAGIIYDSSRPDGLSSAVKKLPGCYPELKNKALKGASKWLSEQSPRRFIEEIVKCMANS